MNQRERFLTLTLVIVALGLMTVPVAAQVFPGAAAVPAEPPPTWEEALRALWRLPSPWQSKTVSPTRRQPLTMRPIASCPTKSL